MLKKNQDVKLSISGFTSDGAGVGRAGDMAVFVPGAIENETVKAHIIKVNKTYAVGKLIEVLSPSADRIAPACPHFSRCGGCTLMHMSYEAELKQKRQRVADAFSRIGGFDIEVDDILPSPQTERYRNKAQFPAGIVDGRAVFGFYSQHSHRVVQIDGCLLIPDEINAVRAAAEKWLNVYNVPVYDETTGQGLVRHLFVRRGYHSNETQVCVVAAKDKLPHQDELIAALKDACADLVSVAVNVNAARTNVIMGERTLTLWGKDAITDTLCGLKFDLSPQAFYQVNTAQAERLYAAAKEKAGKGETLVDLYCGAGTIGLSMADAFTRVIGVEIVPQAIKNAKENAKRNGVDNAEFICGDASAAASKLKADGVTQDAVIVDPPRKGCDAPLLQTVADMSPARVVYVSCDPATCARDCRILADLGYTLCSVTPVDMFPRTAHVECVTLITRNR